MDFTKAMKPDLQDPVSGKSLVRRPLDEATAIWSSPGGLSWPEIAGIPFLHSERLDLAAAAVGYLEAARPNDALALLLTHVDPFAKLAPSQDDAHHAIEQNQNGASAHELMRTLRFGAVADYFGIRGATPTFYSGLALLRRGVSAGEQVVEIACGTGHFLYWLWRNKVKCLGVDTVFSKLWLGRNFFFPHQEVSLICADIVAGEYFPLRPMQNPTTVFCHDAFYFFPDKRKVMQRFATLGAGTGRTLIGHAHVSDAGHGMGSGTPLTGEQYRQLWLQPVEMLNDADLSAAETREEIRDLPVEAISMISPNRVENSIFPEKRWPSDEPMALTTLLHHVGPNGETKVVWPQESFALEYAATAQYLQALCIPAGADVPEIAAVPRRFISFAVSPLRWGIIGAGWITRDYMLPAFAKTAFARLVRVVDTNPASLAALPTIFSRVHLSREADDIFNDPDIDAIYLATPNSSHRDLCLRALQAGKHVLCEKPLATTSADAAAMVAAAKKHGVHLACAFDQRFHPAHAAIHHLIHQKEVLGRVTQARIHYACWISSTWQKADFTSNWRIDSAVAGGGAAIDLMPHGIDLLAYLLQSEVCDITLKTQRKIHDYTNEAGGVEDGAVALVQFANQVLATIHVGYNCPEFIPRRQLEIIGEKGRIFASNTMGQDPGGTVEVVTASQTVTTDYGLLDLPGPFDLQLDTISRAWCLDEVFPFSAARDTRHLQLLLDALEAAR